MSPDATILLSVGGSLSIFLILHGCLFRLFPPTGSVYGLLGNLVISWLWSLFIGWWIILTWPSMIFILVIFAAVHSLAVASYMFGVFTIVHSSIHVALLRTVAGYPRGITRKELRKHFGRDKLIKERVEQLVSSGELVVTGSVYRQAKHFSLLKVRERLGMIIEQMVNP